MTAQNNVAPVIIKRKKVVSGGGHHGGAWKVAYADFVTAMMAFFLLMWLLNATTEKQRKGLADYFSPTITISRISSGSTESLFGDRIQASDMLPTPSGVGGPQMLQTSTSGHDKEIAKLKEVIETGLNGFRGESMAANQLMRHIITRVTDEGLVVELFDRPNAPLFEPGTDQPTGLMVSLADILVELGGLVINNIAVEGHVRAAPVVLIDNPIWDRSSARADKVRQMIDRPGIDTARMNRVTGHADREPAVQNPMAPRNNRIEVIFLRSGPAS